MSRKATGTAASAVRPLTHSAAWKPPVSASAAAEPWPSSRPERLAATFRTGVAELYREGQLMQQAVLAEFIMDG